MTGRAANEQRMPGDSIQIGRRKISSLSKRQKLGARRNLSIAGTHGTGIHDIRAQQT